MLYHYLKIAYRNMWKYKSQTLISLIGLTVGFTCFALATLWIRYEMTYDSFHKNAKQMYVVYRPNSSSATGYSRSTVNPLAAYLKEAFPEIENATPIVSGRRLGKVTVEDVEFPALTIRVDSTFFRMFDVKILEGSREFLIIGSNKLAITREKARELFGNENPIGKTINGNEEICAVVLGMSKRSNYAFDFIGPFSFYAINESQKWNTSWSENTIIKLFPNTNIEDFKKKLYEHVVKEGWNLNKLIIKPLTKVRYTDPEISREVEIRYIFIFGLCGLLIILCSMFNYLTLFMSRFRIRQKELALRMVCGASGSSLLAMLSVEFMLTLIIAVLLGCELTQLIHKPFMALSDIQMDLLAIYRESLLYIGGVILVSLLTFWLILFIFRHRSLNLSIRWSNKKLFRKVSVLVQLVISIGFAFCTLIILKQMHFLHNTDELGISFKNRGSIRLLDDELSGVVGNQLKRIPEIMEIVDAKGITSLIPLGASIGIDVSSWDEKPVDAEKINLEIMYVSSEYADFYDFRLLAGEMLTGADPDSLVMLNERAVKAFGWNNPIGKQFDNIYTVKGVIRNVYNLAPTVPAEPVCYMKRPQSFQGQRVMYNAGTTVLFKYREGMWKTCKEKIEQIMNNEYADLKYEIYNTEEMYDRYLKTEVALIKLLSFVSAICVLICIFGFVSLVSLTCEERRKAIAIRKINGATVGDILAIFAKEYFLLLLIGAAIAFSAGYLIMHRWLENYVKQTSIAAWVYLTILFVLALVIVLCVGWQVYKTSVENPAEVVKRE